MVCKLLCSLPPFHCFPRFQPSSKSWLQDGLRYQAILVHYLHQWSRRIVVLYVSELGQPKTSVNQAQRILSVLKDRMTARSNFQRVWIRSKKKAAGVRVRTFWNAVHSFIDSLSCSCFYVWTKKPLDFGRVFKTHTCRIGGWTRRTSSVWGLIAQAVRKTSPKIFPCRVSSAYCGLAPSKCPGQAQVHEPFWGWAWVGTVYHKRVSSKNPPVLQSRFWKT